MRMVLPGLALEADVSSLQRLVTVYDGGRCLQSRTFKLSADGVVTVELSLPLPGVERPEVAHSGLYVEAAAIVILNDDDPGHSARIVEVQGQPGVSLSPSDECVEVKVSVHSKAGREEWEMSVGPGCD